MNEEELAEKFEERVRNWADSYENKSSYTQGKIVGAMYAVNMFKDMVYDE